MPARSVQLSCFSKVTGDLGQSPVGALRILGEDRECLVRSDAVPFHENALGLTDPVPRNHGLAKLLGTARIGQGEPDEVAGAGREPHQWP